MNTVIDTNLQATIHQGLHGGASSLVPAGPGPVAQLPVPPLLLAKDGVQQEKKMVAVIKSVLPEESNYKRLPQVDQSTLHIENIADEPKPEATIESKPEATVEAKGLKRNSSPSVSDEEYAIVQQECKRLKQENKDLLNENKKLLDENKTLLDEKKTLTEEKTSLIIEKQQVELRSSYDINMKSFELNTAQENLNEKKEEKIKASKKK
jgi:hypothetical protein